MKFMYSNRKELDEKYIHDSYFEGFHYDYEKHQILISCIDGFCKKRNFLVFNEVIFLEMQSCRFWGQGNSIYHMWHEDESVQMKRLIDLCNANGERIPEKCQYIQIQIQLNSADTLFIICESLDWSESALEYKLN